MSVALCCDGDFIVTRLSPRFNLRMTRRWLAVLLSGIIGAIPDPALASLSEESQGGYRSPVLLGELQDQAINESSGLVASRENPGLLWTHNDSGDGAFIYCVKRDASSCGTWSVNGAQAFDWEDIAAGPGPNENKSYLYVGDIGDNEMKRGSVVIYRFQEPTVSDTGTPTTKDNATPTTRADVLTLTYPDGSHDAEALLIHPNSGNLFIITKVFEGSSQVFRAKAPLEDGTTTTMTQVGQIRVGDGIPNAITAGDISPNARRVGIVTYVDSFELRLPRRARPFGRIWKQELVEVPVAERKQGESIAYRIDGKALLTTSEMLPAPLYEVVRRGY